MAQLNIAQKVQLWLHGMRLGLTSDGQQTTTTPVNSSALVLDGVPIASTRPLIIKAVTSLSGAGAVTVAGAVINDNVLFALDLSGDTDVTSSFESTITVTGQIQQSASTSGHTVLLIIQPQS